MSAVPRLSSKHWISYFPYELPAVFLLAVGDGWSAVLYGGPKGLIVGAGLVPDLRFLHPMSFSVRLHGQVENAPCA